MVSTSGRGILQKWAGTFVFGLALMVYLATLSPVYHPVHSAAKLAQHLHLTPFPSMTNMVWGWLIRAVAALPLGEGAWRLNATSAVLGALVVWMVYRLVAGFGAATRADGARDSLSPVWGGLAAALALMVCLPYWMVSTRASPLTFDLALGLLSFLLLQRALKNNRLGLLYASAAVYGLACAEFSSMYLIAPVYGVAMLLALVRLGALRARSFLLLAASFVAGLSPYLFAAMQFRAMPAYEWRAFEGFFQVLKYTWLEQYLTISRGIPRVGWLTIGFVAILPWAVAILYRLGLRSPQARSQDGQLLVHGMLGALATAVIFEFPLAPWSVTGAGVPLVTPYAFSAIAIGLVVFYFLEARHMGPPNLRRPGTLTAAALLLTLAPLVAGAFHVREIHRGEARNAVAYADAVLDSLDGRPWLITASGLDEVLALRAWDRDIVVRLLDPRAAQSDAYQAYLAAQFDDARLQALARVGLMPLLQEWLATPAAAGQVAVMGAQDVWDFVGLEGVPVGLVYWGVAPEEALPVDVLVARLEGLLKGPLAWCLNEAEPAGPTLRRWNEVLRREVSKQANNLGVYAEEQDRPDLAWTCYATARSVFPENISALINQHVMARRDERPERESLNAEIETRVKALEGKAHTLWSLARDHGFIRAPETYANRGWAWAMSGKPRMAVRELKRAIKAGGKETPAATLALAQLYFQQDDQALSEGAYMRLLEVNPEHQPALLGLARLAAQRGDFASARARMQQLRDLKADPQRLLLEEAVMESVAGEAARARALLLEAVASQPDDLRAWAALATVAAHLKDEGNLRLALEKLKDTRSLGPAVRLMLAQIAVGRGEYAAARREVEEVLRLQPAQPVGLEMMTRFSMGEGDRLATERFVEQLLAVDSRHAFANYVLGALQFGRGEHALAESSYRASLASHRAPETINDLADVLAKRGALQEAEALVREALQAVDTMGSAWDTLAVICLRTDRTDEAAEALQRAIALRPESLATKVHLAELHERQGRKTESLALADELLVSTADLDHDDAESLRALVRRLRGGE